MTLPIVERLRRYVTVADRKALASVPPSSLREAADAIETLYEALESVRSGLAAADDAYRFSGTISVIDATLAKARGEAA